jgi:hypothetical protein
MLEARVTTELIDLYAKGVLRNMAVEALPGVEFTDADESALDVLAAGEAAPRSVAPDGHTIPAANREDEVDSDVRAGLRATLSILEREQPAVFVALQVRWTATTRPPLGSPNFTVSHGQLLEYMIAEAIGPSVNPGSGSGSAAVEPDPGPTPEHVHDDDSPEAYGPDEEPFE